MKKFFLASLFSFVFWGILVAQNPTDVFSRIEKSIQYQRYTDAYAVADSVRTDALRRMGATGVTNEISRTLLTSTWYMEVAAINYQEDVKDSSLARFRAILPYMNTVDRSLCYLFLEDIDSALVDSIALRNVSNNQIAPFCSLPNERNFNVTPTMYDMVMHMAKDRVPLEQRIRLLQQLVAWYRAMPASRENTALLLFNERDYVRSLAQRPNTSQGRKYALYHEFLNRYRRVDDPQVASLYYELAGLYDADSNYLTALAYCDSAISRYPESEWGVAAANLREKILTKWIFVKMEAAYPKGRDILCSVKTRNVKTLYYRIVDASNTPQDYTSDNALRNHLLGCKVLRHWSQDLEVNPDHREYKHYAYLPSLPSGHYALLVSATPDFSSDGFYVCDFSVFPVAFVRTKDVCEGYLVDYATGAPIPNQKVLLQKSKNYSNDFKTQDQTVTDKHGFYRFDRPLSEGYGIRYRVLTHYDGIEVASNDYWHSDNKDSVNTEYQVFLDRPVYRPGDTLQFLLVEGEVRHNQEGKTVQGDSLMIALRDVNWQTVDSLYAVTDAYGSISGRLVVPAQVLPGIFTLQAFQRQPNAKYVQKYTRTVKVEAYKQPKFSVTLKSADRRDASGLSLQPKMGDSLVVDGLAASYSQVPISNAKVSYQVSRSFLRPWWRRFYGGPWGGTTVVASDSLLTDAEGHFRIAFKAAPDSSIELSTKPCFVYTVRVDVTDLNGETHGQSLPLRLGYENSFINITSTGSMSVWNAVEYQYCDLNGTPLQGDMTLSVERLRQPKRLWLDHAMIDGQARHTMPESDFRHRFPYTPYSYDETLMRKWPTEKVVFQSLTHCQGLNSNSVPLPNLEPGAYRIRMSCGDISNESVVVYTPSGSSKVQTMDLLWFDQSHSQAQVGDTVLIRVGSRHHDVTAVYQLLHDRQELDRRLLPIDDNITTLRIPVTDRMLGGFDICLYAVKEGRSVSQHIRVEVPFVHKQLDVQFLTFRDKLIPGERETWTLNLKRKAATPSGRQPVAVGDGAALLLSMYDASLDTYGSLAYAWWPWRNAYFGVPNPVEFYVPYYLSRQENLLISHTQYKNYKGGHFGRVEFSALHHRGWRWYSGRDRILTATARGESAAPRASRMKMTKVNKAATYDSEPQVETELSVVSDVEVEEVGYDEFGEVLEEDETGVDNGSHTSGPAMQPYLRTNLSTLAFFEPTLRTAPDGTVSYSFTAPDLLTQWNVKGLAWTRDLAIGQVERSLITQKQLMIQPNMPRFLREGDTATLMAKVMNLTDSDMTVMVDFSFEIPATTQRPMQHHADSREVHLPAHGNAMVAFPVTIPVGGTVATYRYMACASHHSDGEQGPLPLLTNRQAVTTSVSMFMNGKGSKEYTMSLPTSSTAEPVSFTVEYTANPIWMAIQTLPYMAECANPSTIYLFNSFYVNTIGKTIADLYPQLSTLNSQLSTEDSPLFRNEEVRQTLLSETPWLRDGTSEVERMRQIAKYYDGAALQRQVAEALAKLQKAQRADGSWSWMPDGQYGSTYVTHYLLKGLGSLSRQRLRTSSHMERRALDYADKEAYKVYQEWMDYLKKHPGSTFRPIMLDYLYTRSYFSNHALSTTHQKAYDYFYSNARLHYSNYTSLYDQALLALVFQRRGDTRLAREMVTRIKQKALYSEEMGMYWRDNQAGYFYYQRPVETQALLIETFREVTPADTLSIGQMQQWLLKQKQTTRWYSDVATLRAIQALMPADKAARHHFGRVGEADRLVVKGGAASDTLATPVDNSGYLRHTYRTDSLSTLSRGGSIATTILRPNKGISWGALYYQYTEQMDKIPASETGIRMSRQLFRVSPDGSLVEIAPSSKHSLHVGDKLRIVLTLSCDRNLEYVELKNFRAACLEPVSTTSGWCWTRGLSYYVAVNNSHDALYIDRLDKGKYTIESTYYVPTPGTFTLAPAVLQCLYAPEFRSTTPGQKLTIEQ